MRKVVCTLMCWMLSVIAVWAQAAEIIAATPSAETATPSAPESCYVGLYITSLSDLNLTAGSFNVEFWAWSVCPTKDLKPLESLEIIDAVSVQRNYDSVVEKSNVNGLFKSTSTVYWAQQKIAAKIRHSWDVRNFPFDRHTLRVVLEETLKESREFVYQPDVKHTDYRKEIMLDGWKIRELRVKAGDTAYNTTFGDPKLTSAVSHYSRLEVALDIERENRTTFFKVFTGVYTALAIIMLSFLVSISNRIGLLAGTSFLILMSMNSAVNSVVGQNSYLTLADKIHIVALVYLVLAIVAAVYAMILDERQQSDKAIRHSRKILLPIFVVSCVAINLGLVLQAMR